MASVLVLEDDVLIGDLVAEWLSDAGHRVRGPVTSVEDALSVVAEKGIDAGLLDVRMGDGGSSFELARMLQAQHIPFAFLTGYPQLLMPPDLRDCPRLEKPFDQEQVTAMLRRLLQPPARPPSHRARSGHRPERPPS